MVAKNHRSVLKHSKFVVDYIDVLVQSHCVRESVFCPKIVGKLSFFVSASLSMKVLILSHPCIRWAVLLSLLILNQVITM